MRYSKIRSRWSPADPKSAEPHFQTDVTRRFEADVEAGKVLANTVKLAALTAEDFDMVFYPGGHGPLWDLAESKDSSDLIECFIAANKPVALVCHAPGVLRHVRTPECHPLVASRRVSGFTNTEEAGVGLTKVVPFLVEDELKALGGNYSSGPDRGSYVAEDGLLITGQNPVSSSAAAQRLVDNCLDSENERISR